MLARDDEDGVADINRDLSSIRDAKISALQPPPIDNLGNSSGFSFRLQDRGQKGFAALTAAVGLVIGLAASAFAARAMQTMLYGVGPFDLVAFASMALVLFASAAVASYIPARRATKVDPMIVLRN